ncbi:MAG: alpha/beta hydrolase [Candidatus Hydrogenedentota bacterium]|nr:MAG: alpha/beta hydrolase [Candidatus Hydrogenedentota bacterium]
MFKRVGTVLGICIAAFLGVIAFGMILRGPIPERRLKELGIIERDSLFMDVDGVRTRYIERGEGKKAIIFIHGFASSLSTWRSCLEPISKQYRIFALDLKGFGFSGKPASKYTTDEYADFVIHFMDALELQAATLCGNSMGGNIAWRTALKYPERIERIILVDAAGYPSEHRGMPFFLNLGRLPGVGEIVSTFITRGRIRSSLQSAYYDTAKVTEQTVDAYYYPMRTAGARRAVLARLRGFPAEIEEWKAKIRDIKLPTLIIWGADDTWIEREHAERFHRDIIGSALVIIPECGHLPQEEKPGEFAISILDFMSEHEDDILINRPTAPARRVPLTELTV